MANTLTKRDLFSQLLSLKEVQSRPELVNGLNHELELLDRKNASSKKESKVTEEIQAEVYEALSKYDNGTSLKVLISENFKDRGFTSQKLVPVMKVLISKGAVSRTVEKRVAIFKVVA